MPNCCKDCDRLRPSTSGTAPVRPEYNVPTAYDHFTNFQRFKQAKEEEEEEIIRACKGEFMTFDPSFTDYHFSKISGREGRELGQHPAQDCAQLRQELNVQNFSEIHEVVDKANAENALPVSRQASSTLVKLSRTPVICPVGSCGHTIGSTSVLSHILQHRNDNFGIECQDIYAGKRSVLIFDETILEFKENICLGVLAYGGLDTDNSSSPAERGLCMHNAFLPRTYEHLFAHMPILIMICKTSWNSLLLDKEMETQVTDLTNTESHILVIWLVTGETTKPIHCTVTVFDKAMLTSRSSIIQVRHIKESQNPSDFLRSDTNYLRLCRGEVDKLSHGGSKCIQMEIMVNEYN